MWFYCSASLAASSAVALMSRVRRGENGIICVSCHVRTVPEAFCSRVSLCVSESMLNLVNTISSEKNNEGNFTQFWPHTYLGSQVCWLDVGVKGQKSRSQQAEA